MTAPAFARFPFSRQLATFLAVGIASAALDVGLLAGLLRLGVAYEIATTVSFFVALAFNYFPAFGYQRQSWGDARFLLLPVSLMIVISLGSDARLYRAVFLEEISQDYVRTAQAKGVSNTRLLMVHVLKNGMIALITYVVAQLPLLILGSLLVENFFGIPGLGNTLVAAIQTSDLAVIRSTTFLTAILYIVGLTVTDICYAAADPRIRLS